MLGLVLAVVNIDAVIKLIRESPDPRSRARLMETPCRSGRRPACSADQRARPRAEDGHYRLSEEQAKAILELRLQRLTGLERDKLGEGSTHWS